MQQKAPAPDLAAGRAAPRSTLPATPRALLRARSRPAVVPQRTASYQPARAAQGTSAKTVGSFVPRLTRPAFERYGFSAAALITDWATIVGADLARYTMPERLKWPKRVDWSVDDVSETDRGRPGATLILAVVAGRALDVEYRSAQLMERINAYFGYRAVASVRIVQVASIRPAAAEAPPAATGAAPHAPAKPREELAAITEPTLRTALERMAQGLVARKSRGRAAA
jgi:hypothetical protein